MDFIKEVTKYGIKGGLLLAALYLISLYIAPMSQGYIAAIPIDLGSALSYLITLALASAGVELVEKNWLKKYV